MPKPDRRRGSSAPRHDIQQRQRHRDTRATKKGSAIKLHDKFLAEQSLGVRLTTKLSVVLTMVGFAVAVGAESCGIFNGIFAALTEWNRVMNFEVRIAI